MRWLPGRTSPLPQWRWAAGWALALAGPAALGGGLATTRSEHSNATELMGFLTLSVAVALVGGLLPALVAAVLGSAILNYFFTPPRYTWKIAEPEQELALIVFVLVAAAVASVVDLAERRRQQADRSRAESETLSLLAGSVLRGEDSVAAVLGRLRETFAAPGAALEERDPGGVWHPVETSGQVAGDAREVVEVGPTLRLVLCTGTLSDDDRRVVTAFASHAGVVLERERLRARAAEAHRLEQGIAVRTALLAAVSHDLRTPLAAIRAASSSLLLRDVEWSPRDRDELVETVADGAERLQALIDNLLDLSRLQAGVVQPVLSPVALDEVVGPALDGVDDGAVHVDVPDDLPLVRTDAGLLERVLANLLENAVRHATDAPQPVSLTARPADGELEVLVVDHGPGVPDEAKQQVFEPFQRLDDATARGGAGLGLAVARGLATAVGGRLAARDTPGGGLTMALRLPVA